QFGDTAQRSTTHHQPGRKGVTQVVPREVRNLGELKRSVEAVLNVLNWLAFLGPDVCETPRGFRDSGRHGVFQGLSLPKTSPGARRNWGQHFEACPDAFLISK